MKTNEKNTVQDLIQVRDFRDDVTALAPDIWRNVKYLGTPWRLKNPIAIMHHIDITAPSREERNKIITQIHQAGSFWYGEDYIDILTLSERIVAVTDKGESRTDDDEDEKIVRIYRLFESVKKVLGADDPCSYARPGVVDSVAPFKYPYINGQEVFTAMMGFIPDLWRIVGHATDDVVKYSIDEGIMRERFMISHGPLFFCPKL